MKIKVLLLWLMCQQNAQRVFVMQISAAIIKKSNFHYISANNVNNCKNKLSRPTFSGSEIIRKPFQNILRVLLTWRDFESTNLTNRIIFTSKY